MSEPGPVKRPFSLWRRVLWILGVPLLVALLVALGLNGYRGTRASNDLATILRDLDENDPGWRLDGIEAARLQLPDEENSAVLCQELVKMFDLTWPDPKLDAQFRDIPLGELLDERRKVILEDEMTRLVPIRSIARRMVDLPKGRHNHGYAFDPRSTIMKGQADTRKVARLYEYEMRYRANRGDVSEAVRACRGCVCAARSMYDDPMPIAIQIRIASVHIGIFGVERSLALGESNDAELAALDELLADEERHNTLLDFTRGERATIYLVESRMIADEIPAEDIFGIMNRGKRSKLDNLFINKKQVFRRRFPQVMTALNRAVEIAHLPSHEQEAAVEAFADEAEEEDEVAARIAKALHAKAATCRRKTAQVAAMRGLIAVERYRMKHGKWPAKLGDVVPAFLKGVPLDPFDGKPIRMARVADGVIVYSVGADRVDDGGKLNRGKPMSPGFDLGFQLWDVAKRRRPASPVVEVEPEEKDP